MYNYFIVLDKKILKRDSITVNCVVSFSLTLVSKMKVLLLTALFAISGALANETIRLRLYKGSTAAYTEASLFDAELTIFRDFFSYNSLLKTVFIFHGFTSSADADSIVLVANAFLKKGGINVIGVDWRVLAYTENSFPAIYYKEAAQNTKIVGESVAALIDRLDLAGLLLINNLVLVGHSLGAQTCGVIGRSLKRKPPLIIGLDPAGPLFSSTPINGSNRALSKYDAVTVHAISTDSTVLGTLERNVTASFIPNSGLRSMPGCAGAFGFEISCSHSRAYEYFADAISNPDRYRAVRCKSLKGFITNTCSKGYIKFGYPVDKSANGLYYFETSDKLSYGKGQAGTVNKIKYRVSPKDVDFV